MALRSTAPARAQRPRLPCARRRRGRPAAPRADSTAGRAGGRGPPLLLRHVVGYAIAASFPPTLAAAVAGADGRSACCYRPLLTSPSLPVCLCSGGCKWGFDKIAHHNENQSTRRALGYRHHRVRTTPTNAQQTQEKPTAIKQRKEFDQRTPSNPSGPEFNPGSIHQRIKAKSCGRHGACTLEIVHQPVESRTVTPFPVVIFRVTHAHQNRSS